MLLTHDEVSLLVDWAFWEKSLGKNVPRLGETPVLIDFEESVVDPDVLLRSHGTSVIRRKEHSLWARFFKKLSAPSKAKTESCIRQMSHALLSRGPRPTILVVGGGTIGQGVSSIYMSPKIGVVGVDIYATPNVQVVADAHRLPFFDDSFDAVVVQAVLEHVLRPHVVVSEISRVLKPGGFVYAETPFLQHVHEGPYDFTRFTDSGHRFLFREFQELGSGSIGGVGTQLQWSLEYFARGLFRSRRIGKIAKCMLFWLPMTDRIAPNTYNIDAASGVYFYGRKSDKAIGQADIIRYYKGAQ